MNKLKQKLAMSFFMILLILSMPFVTAISINSFTAVGKKGIDGVIEEDDEITFTTIVDMMNQDRTPQELAQSGQLKVRGSSEFAFDSCVWENQASNLIKCSKKLNIDTSSGSSFYYDVLIANVGFGRRYLYLDTTGPSPSDIIITASQVSGKISYTLDVKDRVDAGTGCSGLKSYDLYLTSLTDSGFSERRIKSGNFEGECHEIVSGEADPQVSTIGEFRLCAKITDMFGNEGSDCTTLIIDGQAPDIQEINLLTSEGNPLRGSIHSSGGNVIVEVKAFEISRNLAQTGSRFNINGGSWVNLNVHSLERLPTGNLYTLRGNAQISAENSVVKVEIVDGAGNVAYGERVFNIQADTTGPSFRRFTSEIMDGNRMHLRQDSYVDVTFEESGSGMYNSDASIYFNNRHIPAEKCSLVSGNTWVCSFFVDGVSGISEGSHPISVSAQTADDVGNKVTGITDSYSVVVDKTPPKIVNHSISGISSIGEIPVVGANSRVRLRVEVEDMSSVSAVANFSVLAPPGSNPQNYIVRSSCPNNVCEFLSEQIGEGGLTRQVPVVFTDFAGNSLKKFVEIKILRVDGSSDVWEGKFSASPKAFDREVSTFLNQKSYVMVDLLTDIDDMTIIDVRYNRCVSPANLSKMEGGREYFANINKVSSSEDMSKQYLLAELRRSDMFIDRATVLCEFTVSSYDSEFLYPSENVVVDVSFGFYNNPLGAPDEKLQAKIDAAVEETQGIWKTLDSIYKWVYWLEKICSIYNTIMGIINGIATILFILSSTESGLRAAVITQPAAQGVAAAQHPVCEANYGITVGADKGFMNFIGKFCKWVTCDLPVSEWIDSAWDLGGITDGFANFAGKIDDSEVDLEATTFGRAARANENSLLSSDSIITQVLRLCVPGLLKKAHEWRAIKCGYVSCLIEFQGTGEGTESACEDIKANMECRFIFGELWSMIPFIGILEHYMNLIQMMMTDYIFALVHIAHWACTAACKMPVLPGLADWGCGAVFKITKLLDSIGMLMKIANNFSQYFNFEKQANACDDMESALEKMTEESESYQERLKTRTSQASSPSSQASSSLPRGYGGVS